VEWVNSNRNERPILGELRNTCKLEGGAKSKTTVFLHVGMSNKETLPDCLQDKKYCALLTCSVALPELWLVWFFQIFYILFAELDLARFDRFVPGQQLVLEIKCRSYVNTHILSFFPSPTIGMTSFLLKHHAMATCAILLPIFLLTSSSRSTIALSTSVSLFRIKFLR
jgi:hypothetical protein